MWTGEKYAEVTKFFNNGVQNILRITLKDGRIIKCTPNHKLYVLREGIEQWIEAEDILQTDNICVYHSYNTSTGTGISECMCKFLGYMIGNGCWYHTKMNLYTPPHKLTVVEDILNTAVSEGWLRGYKHIKSRSGNCYDTQIYFKKGYRQIWNNIVGLHVGTRGQKQLPDIVYRFNKQELLQFIEGWFLADGSSIEDTFLPSEHTGQITCNYDQLIYPLQTLCSSFGIDLRIYRHEYNKMTLPGGRVKEGNFVTNSLRCSKQSGYFVDNALRKYFFDRAHRTHIEYDKNYTYMLNPKRSINPDLINRSKLELLKGDKWFTGIKSIEDIGEDVVYDIEVPETGYFIYNGIKVHNCTTDPQKIIGTIMSRVQRFNFSRISTKGIVSRLLYILQSENITTYENEAVEYIARLAKGGMRDAITTLEKCLDYNSNLTLENVSEATSGGVTEPVMLLLLRTILNKQSDNVLLQFNDIYMSGIDISLFIKLFTEFLENCVKYLITRNSEIVILSDITINWLDEHNNAFDLIEKLLVDIINIRTTYTSEDLRVIVESWLIQICM